jgi:hypothetical protein
VASAPAEAVQTSSLPKTSKIDGNREFSVRVPMESAIPPFIYIGLMALKFPNSCQVGLYKVAVDIPIQARLLLGFDSLK